MLDTCNKIEGEEGKKNRIRAERKRERERHREREVASGHGGDSGRVQDGPLAGLPLQRKWEGVHQSELSPKDRLGGVARGAQAQAQARAYQHATAAAAVRKRKRHRRRCVGLECQRDWNGVERVLRN